MYARACHAQLWQSNIQQNDVYHIGHGVITYSKSFVFTESQKCCLSLFENGSEMKNQEDRGGEDAAEKKQQMERRSTWRQRVGGHMTVFQDQWLI